MSAGRTSGIGVDEIREQGRRMDVGLGGRAIFATRHVRRFLLSCTGKGFGQSKERTCSELMSAAARLTVKSSLKAKVKNK